VPERIHKVLANAGIGSRRSIERWVSEGRITVDGRVAKLGQQLEGRERICLDGKPVRLSPAKLARPRHDFVAYYKPGATRGLLVLTTDGELASRLMHPSATVEREYAVRVLGEPSLDQQRQLEEGIELDTGTAKVAKIEVGKGGGSNTWYHFTLRETRHRDLRSMLAAVGLAVSRVIRVRFGAVQLGELYRGANRALTPTEIKGLYALAGTGRVKKGVA
jgi:23S rRNA pseudouridine2605 synthase